MPMCCTMCCSQDVPELHVGHQFAPKKNALRLTLRANTTTSAALMMMNSDMLRVEAARAITGTTKHAKTNNSFNRTASSDGTSANPLASASTRLAANMGTLIVTAIKSSLASNKCVLLNGLTNQSWSAPGIASW